MSMSMHTRSMPRPSTASRRKPVLEATRLHGATGKKIVVLTTDDEDENDWEDDGDWEDETEKSEPVEISSTNRSPINSDEEEEWSSDSDDEDDPSVLSQPANSWHSQTQANQVKRSDSDHNQQVQRPKSIDVSQAALEAQRQLDLFAKKPKRAWSGISRTGSGLLSQLMNPSPEIFPANHPYRSPSTGEVSPAPGRKGFGGGIAPLTPTESKSQQVQQEEGSKRTTNGGRGGKFHIGTSPPPRTQALRSGKASAVEPVADAITAVSVGYRPRGRPADTEFDSDDETEPEESKPPISSVAEQKLALLAGRRNAAATKQKANAAPTPPRPHLAPRSATDSPTSRPSIPVVQRTHSQPAKIRYPYNLPPPIPPSSPRTTVQLMLRSEMSESVRYNLLWSRQLNRAETMGPRRRSSGASSDTSEPTTTLPTVVHLSAKKKPGRGVFLDETPQRLANSRRSSTNAVPSARTDTERDVDGIHVGGGPNVITRSTSWTNLGRTTGFGMTKIS